MKAHSYLTSLIAISEKHDHVTVNPQAVRPLPGGEVSIDGLHLSLTPPVANRFDAWMQYPSKKLHGRISEDTEQLVLDEMHRRWLDQQDAPSELQIVISDDQLVQIRDASHAAIDFGQIAEILLSMSNPQFPLEQATVSQPRATLIDGHGLDLRFVFDVCQAEPRRGDVVRGGLRIISSPSGPRPLIVTNYLERLLCKNGMTSMICQDASTDVEKRGSRLRIRGRAADDLDDMVEKFRTVVSLGYSQLAGKLEAVERLAATPISDVDLVLKEIAMRHRLSTKTTKLLRQALTQDEAGEVSSTSFDVINAVSRVATHGQIPNSVAERLGELAGGASAAPFHVCKQCRRVLHPSLN